MSEEPEEEENREASDRQSEEPSTCKFMLIVLAIIAFCIWMMGILLNTDSIIQWIDALKISFN